ncbi:hypothetical protein RB195_010488 [Necator americanus]|uniref:Uncharacterized protein n=1 Tax=Necator americanus TaxID=51031 RepID=A0ABR1CYY4_NECAM
MSLFLRLLGEAPRRQQCGDEYIGETAGPLCIRIKEHLDGKRKSCDSTALGGHKTLNKAILPDFLQALHLLVTPLIVMVYLNTLSENGLKFSEITALVVLFMLTKKNEEHGGTEEDLENNEKMGISLRHNEFTYGVRNGKGHAKVRSQRHREEDLLQEENSAPGVLVEVAYNENNEKYLRLLVKWKQPFAVESADWSKRCAR